MRNKFAVEKLNFRIPDAIKLQAVIIPLFSLLSLVKEKDYLDRYPKGSPMYKLRNRVFSKNDEIKGEQALALGRLPDDLTLAEREYTIRVQSKDQLLRKGFTEEEIATLPITKLAGLE